jgi:hypothetical protein
VQNGKQALPYGRASDAVIENERVLTEPRALASDAVIEDNGF